MSDAKQSQMDTSGLWYSKETIKRESFAVIGSWFHARKSN